VNLAADAFDSDGTVQLVEFFEGTNKFGESASAPFSLVWSNVPAGRYRPERRAPPTISATPRFQRPSRFSCATSCFLMADDA